MRHHTTLMMLMVLLGVGGMLLVGCPAEGDDDDDSVGDDDDDDTTGDDDDSAGDDDDSAGDDDDTTGDDDDTAGDDDDTTSLPEPAIGTPAWNETAEECRDPLAMTLEGEDTDLSVGIDNWEIQCCLELQSAVSMTDATTVRIDFVDVGEPCDCMACYDVDVAVTELPAGSYQVEVYFDVGSGTPSLLTSGQVAWTP